MTMRNNYKKYRYAKTKVIVSAFVAVTSLNGCLNSPSGEQPGNKSEGDDSNHTVLLTAVTDNVIIPAYQTFVDQTKRWTNETNVIDSYCDAIGSDTETTTLAAAQQTWKETMATWQQAEAFQIGPITDNSFNLRNRIYSWPEFVSSCTVDRNVVLAETAIDIETAAHQGRGLDTLEYLLFNNNLSHSCPSQIIETQNWNNRSEQERKTARCNYAKIVTSDIANNAQQLLNSWLADGDNYREKLLNSGGEQGAFDSQDAALNALSDALFHIESNVKDTKIAIPTGISTECDAINCPEDIESFQSDNSLQNIKNNLIGFRSIFTGSADTSSTVFSFDDLLFTKNFPEISTQILEDVDSLIELINNIDGSFVSNINSINSTETETECTNASSNPDTASNLFSCQIHGKLKRINDQLKGDFLTVISLQLPSRVEGDND